MGTASQSRSSSGKAKVTFSPEPSAHETLKSTEDLMPLVKASSDPPFFDTEREAELDMMASELFDKNKKSCDQINDTITRLIWISRQIREYRKKKTDDVAVSYEPKDNDERPLVDAFKQHLDFKLDQTKTKMPEGFMKTRMFKTMLMRWRRLSYYSARQPHAKPEPSAGERGDPAKCVQTAESLTVSSDKAKEATSRIAAAKSGKGVGPSKSVASQSHAMTLSASFRPIGRPRSTASSWNPKSLFGVQAFDLPRPPDCPGGADSFTCPYCGDEQSRSVRESTNWR